MTCVTIYEPLTSLGNKLVIAGALVQLCCDLVHRAHLMAVQKFKHAHAPRLHVYTTAVFRVLAFAMSRAEVLVT